MKINIKNLYIGEIGRFVGFNNRGRGYYVEYETLEQASFFVKQGDKFYNLFTGRAYDILQSGHDVPDNGIGLVEPKKYDEVFLDCAIDKINKNPMFTIQELELIDRELKNSSVFASFKIEKIIKYRENELSM